MNSKKKIIIFRTDRLGDFIIHSRPIYELRKKIKNSYIIVVCSKLNKKILNECNYIDELIIYDKNLFFLSRLKIFFSIIFNKYYAAFILDGKNFSYLCNIFLFSKYKFGMIYRSYIFILKKKLSLHKPSKLYASFFFTKYETFTSRKYLTKNENLCQKYLNLFNFFNLDLKSTDGYFFEPNTSSIKLFEDIKKFINLKDYVLIHFDEKWLDITNHDVDLKDAIDNFYSNIKKTIIITSYNNNFRYFKKLKQSYNYFNLHNNQIHNLKNSNIFILDNLEIFLFEQFLKNSIINISCHSGFIAQVCGANSGKLIDIINEKDLEWYSCWAPVNTFHKFIFKSTIKDGQITSKKFFYEISKIINKL